MTYVLGAVTAVGVCVGTLVLMRRRTLSDELLEAKVMPNDASTRSVRPSPKDWKESVAERLKREQERSGPIYEPPTSHDAVPNTVVDELTPELLSALEWKRFELLVARYFEATGYRAELTCTGADGGIDVCLYRANEGRPHAYVQCKAYAPHKFVDAEKVRALFGVMSAAQVPKGVFATTSKFGPEARRFAVEHDIEPIDGAEWVSRFAQLAPTVRQRILAEITAGDYRTPSCPTHDIKMVERVNGNDGSRFFACPQFRCRRRINIRA